MIQYNRNRSKILLALILTFLLTLTSTGFAYARAGGGESFGDGGFDSGSSSSGDFGGSGWSTTSGNGSGINNDGVGCSTFVIIIIIIVIVILASRRKGGSGPGGPTVSDTPITPDHSSMQSEQVNDGLKALKKTDPQFDEQKFKTYSKKVFMSVQEGWTNRDQAVCRPFMSEEVYQSHQMQIENMKKNKTINVLENIVVGSTNIVRVDMGEEYHKIAVKIRASMKDYKVKEGAPEKIIEGTKEQTPPFTEYWVFIRRSTLKTKLKSGLFDRKCPNCGAPIEVSVSGICKYCDANVVNGDYDWVLSEIIQKSEWVD
ncbi:MAG: hypothetical protein UT34_C0001G0095 [candidate division WS6 bacterium GW2011_GWF2_39_15]|uniref:Tim44-like domain-containing protein n=1 Tax=candidate division WS6 bacterium GW2011_GWF2_39_15 TaxID=1619100 RepID=A0A0G0Q6L1_9BACT|nr:MAG: hypothetical protein UT34_C0001G0095 [candidate division WS6 bacterium GW2011_GWF2_39_15]